MSKEQQNHLERMRNEYESKLADQRAKIERDLGVRMRGEVEKARSDLNKEQQDLRLVNLTMDQCCPLLIHYNLTMDRCCLILSHCNLSSCDLWKMRWPCAQLSVLFIEKFEFES